MGCDRAECENIAEGCFFNDDLISNDCNSCSEATCESYDDDEETCNFNPCVIPNCEWDDDSNLCIIGAFCGDGNLDSGETCDDGNEMGGDGCSSSCAIETGYNCVDQPSVCSPIGDAVQFETLSCKQTKKDCPLFKEPCKGFQTKQKIGRCNIFLDEYLCSSEWDSNGCVENPSCPSGYFEVERESCGCDDGTQKSHCSTEKPKFCNPSLQIVDKCTTCGCPNGLECDPSSGSCAVAKAELEFEVTIKNTENIVTGGITAVKYFYDLNLKEIRGVSVNFNKVSRFFDIYGPLPGRDSNWIVGKCGSTNLNDNDNCFMTNRWFFSSLANDVFHETWHGTDENGNTISKEYTVSTNAYSD